MALTLNELKQRLIQEYSEVDLLEILKISSEDIVEAFEDRVLANYDSLVKDVEDDYE